MSVFFPDPKDISKYMDFIIKYLHRDKILVCVAIYQTTRDWNMQVYYKDKKKGIEILKRLFRLNKKGENPDTNKKVKESELFLLLRKKDGSIKLLGPVDSNRYTSENRKQKAERLGSYLLNELKRGLGFLISFSRYDSEASDGSYLLNELKRGLGFLISFSRYDSEAYILIYFTIKKSIIEKGELEPYEIIGEYLDSKELKSYIKRITGMKEQKFKEKLGTRILFAR